MIRVFLSGASGNVGKAVVRSIQARNGFELAGGWCSETGEDLGALAGIAPIGITAADSLEAGLDTAKPDLAIDFTTTHIMKKNMDAYLARNLDAVIGTTGLTEEELAPYEKLVREKGLRWTVIPNYGLGISLVADFIKKARKYYPYVSIVDRHTEKMANAPSGTAAALAKLASEAAEGPGGEISSLETHSGVLGGDIHGIQVLSQRMPWPGPYSEHEIVMARTDEIIRISVEDHTSDVFMDGVFLAAKRISSLPAGSFVRSLSELTD